MNKTLLAASLWLALASSTFAAGNLVDINLISDSSGERIPVYQYKGRYYIAGNPGERYSIEVTNQSGERLMTVISVDGVNIISGQTAATRQSGYVLENYGTYRIDGWRKNMNEVARFIFTALPESYAARTGRPDQVGVIGIAAFREKPLPPPPPPVMFDSSTTSSAPAARIDESRALGSAAPMQEAKKGARYQAAESSPLGTGHGERVYDPTHYTEFVRRSNSPDEIINLYYDSRARLIARGIIPHSPARQHRPNPFPAGNGGFVPDPD